MILLRHHRHHQLLPKAKEAGEEQGRVGLERGEGAGLQPKGVFKGGCTLALDLNTISATWKLLNNITYSVGRIYIYICMGKGIFVADALSKDHFAHVTKGHEKNDLGFLVVMVGGPKTMTKRNSFHFLKASVMGYIVKQTP